MSVKKFMRGGEKRGRRAAEGIEAAGVLCWGLRQKAFPHKELAGAVSNGHPALLHHRSAGVLCLLGKAGALAKRNHTKLRSGACKGMGEEVMIGCLRALVVELRRGGARPCGSRLPRTRAAGSAENT